MGDGLHEPAARVQRALRVSAPDLDTLRLRGDPPRRIVCLTEETTEILYALGQGDRIVGISAWTCRPPEARERHPIVSAFTGANVEKIIELQPDLVVLGHHRRMRHGDLVLRDRGDRGEGLHPRSRHG